MKNKKYPVLTCCLLVLFLFSSCRNKPLLRDVVVDDSAESGSAAEKMKKSYSAYKDGEPKDALFDEEVLKKNIEEMKKAKDVPFRQEELILKEEGPLNLKRLKNEYGIEWDDKEKILALAEPYFDAMEIPETGDDETLSRKEVEKLAARLHYLVSMNYRYAENPLEGGYLIFQEDTKDPLTGETLNSGGSPNIVIVVDQSLTNGKPGEAEGNLAKIKEAVITAVDLIPQSSLLGIRVTGGKSGSVNEKNGSTLDLVPLSHADQNIISMELSKTEGGTLASAVEGIKDAADDLKKVKDGNGMGIIYYITDGGEEVSQNPEGELKKLKNSLGGIKLAVVGFKVSREDELKLLSMSHSAGGTYAGAQEGYEIFSTLNSMLMTDRDSFQWKELDENMISELELQYDSYKYDMKFPYNSERLMVGTLENLLAEEGYISNATKSALSQYFQEYFKFTQQLEETMFQEMDLKRTYLMDSYMKKMGEHAVLIRRKTSLSRE